MKPSPMFTHLLKALCVAFVLSLLCTELAEASAGKDTRGHDNRHNKEKPRQKAARTLGTKAFVSTPSKTISKAWCLVTGSAPSAESRAELAILTAVMGSSPHTTINVASEYEDEPTLKSGILEKVKESNCKYTFISTGGTGTGMNFDRKKGKIDLNKVKIKWHVEKQGEKEPDEFWQQLRVESPFGTSACSCQIDPQLTHVCMNRANSPLSFNGRHGFLLLPRGDIDNEEEMKTYQHIQDQTTLTKQTIPAWFKAVHGLQEQKRAKVCFAQLAFTVKAGELAVDYYSFEPSKKKGVPFELIKATHDECN